VLRTLPADLVADEVKCQLVSVAAVCHLIFDPLRSTIARLSFRRRFPKRAATCNFL